jgi:hypothetical protein
MHIKVWNIILCSPGNVNVLEGQYHLHLLGLKNKPSNKPALLPASSILVCCLAYLKTELICSSEILTDFHQTTEHYTPEDGTLHNYCDENLKSNINMHMFKVLPLSRIYCFSIRIAIFLKPLIMARKWNSSDLSMKLEITRLC